MKRMSRPFRSTLQMRYSRMSDFKDMIKADISDIFIELEYLGETHNVEGKDITIVVDTDELIERQGSQDLAVVESGSLFFAKKSDLPRRRTPGMNLNVDGRECIVDAWEVDMGIVTVALRENVF